MPGLFDRTVEPQHVRLKGDRRVHDVVEFDNGRFTGCDKPLPKSPRYVPEGTTCESCLDAAERRARSQARAQEVESPIGLDEGRSC